MTRRVQVDGYHYQASISSTGIPEGDPLSVSGMWAYSYMFGEVVRQLSGGDLRTICPVTYAVNWEVWGARLQPIIDLLDPLASFVRICRLLVSVEKCWGWCLDPMVVGCCDSVGLMTVLYLLSYRQSVLVRMLRALSRLRLALGTSVSGLVVFDWFALRDFLWAFIGVPQLFASVFGNRHYMELLALKTLSWIKG